VRFQFGWRQAVGVALLLIIAATYIVLRQQGHSGHELTPLMSIATAVALICSTLGNRRRSCWCRRQGEDYTPLS